MIGRMSCRCRCGGAQGPDRHGRGTPRARGPDPARGGWSPGCTPARSSTSRPRRAAVSCCWSAGSAWPPHRAKRRDLRPARRLAEREGGRHRHRDRRRRPTAPEEMVEEAEREHARWWSCAGSSVSSRSPSRSTDCWSTSPCAACSWPTGCPTPWPPVSRTGPTSVGCWPSSPSIYALRNTIFTAPDGEVIAEASPDSEEPVPRAQDHPIVAPVSSAGVTVALSTSRPRPEADSCSWSTRPATGRRRRWAGPAALPPVVPDGARCPRAPRPGHLRGLSPSPVRRARHQARHQRPRRVGVHRVQDRPLGRR